MDINSALTQTKDAMGKAVAHVRHEFETVHTLIHEVGQVIEPMLQPRLRTAFAFGDKILFYNTLIVIDAEPQSQFVTQTVQTTDETAFPFAFWEFMLFPITFGREQFVVPALLG